MRLDLGTFDTALWASVENTTPNYDVLSRKPDYHLFWTLAYSSIPVRSIFEYPVLTEGDLSSLSRVIEYHCHLFNTSNPDEERLLCAIKDRIYSGWYVQIAEETKWDDHNNILIWLTWAQSYLEASRPSGVTDNNV